MEPEAGRALDMQIAERVFGCNPATARRGVCEKLYPGEPQYHWGYPIGHDFAPNYSTDIAAAWQVIEQMRELGWDYDIGYRPDFDTPQHEASFMKDIFSGESVWDIAPTAPLAICRAALKAVEQQSTAAA